MKKFIAIAAISTLALSCSEIETVTPSTESGVEKLTVNVLSSTATTSRVAMAEDADSQTWITSWEDGDALGGWFSDSPSAITKFSMSNYDEKESTFTGDDGSGDLRLIYPYNAAAAIADGEYTLDLSYQTCDVNEPMDRLSTHTHMISGLGDATPSMSHLTTYVDLNLRFSGINEESTNSYYISLIEFGYIPASRNNATISSSQQILMDATSIDGVYGTATTGTITVGVPSSPALTNYETTGDVFSVRFAALPFEIKPGYWVAARVVVNTVSSNGLITNTLERTVSLQNSADAETCTFARGTYNNINAECVLPTSTSTVTKTGDNLLNADFYGFETSSNYESSTEYFAACWDKTSVDATGTILNSSSAYYNSGSYSMRMYDTAAEKELIDVTLKAKCSDGISASILPGTYVLEHYLSLVAANGATGYQIIARSASSEDSEWFTLADFVSASTASTKKLQSCTVIFDQEYPDGIYLGIVVPAEKIGLNNVSVNKVQMFFDDIALYATSAE